MKKLSTNQSKYKVIARSSNLTASGAPRRHPSKIQGFNGIKYIGNHDHDQKERLNETEGGCRMKTEMSWMVQPQEEDSIKRGELGNGSKQGKQTKVIHIGNGSQRKLTLTKRYDALSSFSNVQDKIKQIEVNISTIRQSIRNKPAQNHTFIPSGLFKQNKPSARLHTQPIELPSKKPQSQQLTALKHSTPSKQVQPSLISNFVTQQPEPSKVVRCSSQNNLHSPRTLMSNQHSSKYYISTVLDAFTDPANTTFMQLCRSHLKNSLRQLQGAKGTQKPGIGELPIIYRLPHTNKRHTLVFDLDETLIHCNQKPDMPHDVQLNLHFKKGNAPIKIGINIRPFAFECLKELAEHFQIILFTASHEIYGNAVADYLDPTRSLISYRYFRQSCVKTSDGYIKDLRVIDRPLSNILLIDNAAYSYAFQVENGVPIIPFYDCKTDNELRHLITYFKTLVHCENIRQEHCRILKCHQYGRFAEPEELLLHLYSYKKAI